MYVCIYLYIFMCGCACVNIAKKSRTVLKQQPQKTKELYLYIYVCVCISIYMYMCVCVHMYVQKAEDDIKAAATEDKGAVYIMRGGGLGSRPKKMYGERLGDGVEYHLMSPTPRC